MRDSILNSFHALKSHPNRALRVTAGVLLVLGGLLGALPVLGFWMLPLGLILLSADFYWAKRAHINLRIVWRKIRSRWKSTRLIAGRED
ncbi:MAG: hypothetical protein OES09_08505 [Gammaproteobacteria bacterium]|nr:hypothetical protein [Gammaproteobacteria bacterium]